MLRKSFIAATIVLSCLFAFSLADAVQIDGLQNAGGPNLAATMTTFVNPGALGDALIYGYYNARNELNYFNIVNTSSNTGIAVKIRFREGRNSNEILDFFICLSANDRWSAFIVGNKDTTSPAVLFWYDNDTPTYPDPQNDNDATNNMLASVAMKYGTTGSSKIVTADDTKEGYYEVIGVLTWPDVPGSTKAVRTPKACGQVLGLATETACGAGTAYPEGCQVIPTAFGAPANQLMGVHTIFDTESLQGTFAYNATALGGCIEAPIGAPSLATEGKPTLADCNGGLPAVNYVLTKANEYVIYDVSTALLGNVDVINTFPTRKPSIALGAGWGVNNTKNGAFPDNCIVDSTGEICIPNAVTGDCSGAGKKACCVSVKVSIYDDKENSPSTTGFSPGTTPTPQKCYDVNYVTIGTTKTPLLNTALSAFKVDPGTFQLGWMKEDFTVGTNAYTSFPDAGANFGKALGMPVISYELGGFINGFWTYMLPLRYDTSITITLGTPPT